jgi:hypothetical protein
MHARGTVARRSATKPVDQAFDGELSAFRANSAVAWDGYVAHRTEMSQTDDAGSPAGLPAGRHGGRAGGFPMSACQWPGTFFLAPHPIQARE